VNKAFRIGSIFSVILLVGSTISFGMDRAEQLAVKNGYNGKSTGFKRIICQEKADLSTNFMVLFPIDLVRQIMNHLTIGKNITFVRTCESFYQQFYKKEGLDSLFSMSCPLDRYSYTKAMSFCALRSDDSMSALYSYKDITTLLVKHEDEENRLSRKKVCRFFLGRNTSDDIAVIIQAYSTRIKEDKHLPFELSKSQATDQTVALLLLNHPHIDLNKNFECREVFGDANGKTISFLLNELKIDPNIVDTSGHTMIIDAIWRNNFESLKILLAHSGTNPNGQDHKKRTPLHLAVFYDRPEMVELLLAHSDIDPNIQDDGGNTPLIGATAYKNTKIIRLLLMHPKIDPNIQNDEEKTALHKAVDKDAIENISLLLNHSKIDPNIKDKQGRTPLCSASASNNLEFVKLLLDHQKINLSIKDNDETTARGYAIRYNYREIAKLFNDYTKKS
jgi:ankyrin repeat protein